MTLVTMILVSGSAILVILSGLWVGASLWKELVQSRSESEADSS